MKTKRIEQLNPGILVRNRFSSEIGTLIGSDDHNINILIQDELIQLEIGSFHHIYQLVQD